MLHRQLYECRYQDIGGFSGRLQAVVFPFGRYKDISVQDHRNVLGAEGLRVSDKQKDFSSHPVPLSVFTGRD